MLRMLLTQLFATSIKEEFEWPWNHVEETEVLAVGEVRYSMPYDSKTINMNTFRIKRDADLNVETVKVKDFIL